METPCSEDWNLLAGRHVQIRKDGHLIRTGRVDTVTRAANALWLEGHGAQLRTLFEKAEGYTAWPVPEEQERSGR
ncbi:hypothetical protein LVY72_16930 [Arthrobacter sp. I2-34]|uniref:Uncharacterized protein n=1 Tax=Arthrobacter hankyongi TaxID=2904801 RepID=A0ABS9LA72_9MICC|nr:hypothetical protein [Arthrobacter hankyongi]MCG2623584.1 hypothetical protein [Arthrobacter hankyongi]